MLIFALAYILRGLWWPQLFVLVAKFELLLNDKSFKVRQEYDDLNSLWGRLRPFKAIWGHSRSIEAVWGCLRPLTSGKARDPPAGPYFHFSNWIRGPKSGTICIFLSNLFSRLASLENRKHVKAVKSLLGNNHKEQYLLCYLVLSKLTSFWKLTVYFQS